VQDEDPQRYILWPTRRQLRAARALADIGIRQLARAAGLSPTAISQIETGKTLSARPATLRALRRVFVGYGIEFGPRGWIRHNDDASGLAPERAEPDDPRDVVRAIEDAIHEQRRVRLHYQHPDGLAGRRDVDPYTVWYVSGRLYLVGWCHTRGAIDTFLLSRIRGLQILGHRFEPAPEFGERRSATSGQPNQIEAHAMSSSKTTAKTIGSVCKQARLAIGLTQEEVAEAIGMTADFYARIERGVSVPGLRTLMNLASALHVTVDALLGLPLEPAPGEHDTGPDAELYSLLENASPGTLQVIEALLDALEDSSKS
jgi:transcriptional regulator with XRE-family HTH domain